MALLFGLRFDFRNPGFAATSHADRYAAALDMAEWADALGCTSIAVAEHHGSPDGYLPSPVPMLAAIAARTTSAQLAIAALVAPFYDPIRLAEDLIVLDHLSRGRVSVVLGAGYVPEEFEMYDVPMGDRVRRVEQLVRVLRGAFSGEPFDHDGRRVHVQPGPVSAGPAVLLGGSGPAAARRAARIADGFVPTNPAIWGAYREACLELGKPDPGPTSIGPSTTIFLAEDVEAGWELVGPHFVHETNEYARLNAAGGIDSPYGPVDDLAELRGRGDYAVMTPEQLVADLREQELPFPFLHPMCGGIPVEVAWSSLRLFEAEVLPAFA